MQLFEINHMNTLKILIIILALAAVSCGKKYSEPKPTNKFPDEMQAEVEKITNNILTKNRIPGAIVGIWQDEYEPIIAACGYSNVHTSEPMKPDMHFRIGEITRTFTATAILQQIDDKKLDLTYKLKDFYSEFRNSDTITIKQLLNGTSGLHDFAYDTSLAHAWIKNPIRKWDMQDYIDASLLCPPDFAPGTTFHNTDIAYNLLGMIVERLSEKKLYKYFQKKFFDELEMKNTYISDSTGLESPFSHGYTRNPLTGAPEEATFINPSALWASGSIVSNMSDMHRWIRSLGQGTFLKPETHAAMLDFSDSKSIRCVYGLGVEKTKSLIGHSGNIQGFNTVAYYYPEKKITIIVMVNLTDQFNQYAQEIAFDIINKYFPEALK